MTSTMCIVPAPLPRYIPALILLALATWFFAGHISASEQYAYLPLETGSGWEMRDNSGHFQILIRDKVLINNMEYYRVDWIDETLGGTYQSEFWKSTSDGIYVGGRLVSGQVLMFEEPYLLLKHRPTVGEQWKANIRNQAYSDTIEFIVEKRETITTDIGDLEAVKVILTGRALRIERWYSAGIGLIKEATFKKDKNSFIPFNEKVLAHRITNTAILTSRYDSPGIADRNASKNMDRDPQNTRYVSLLIGTWSVKDEAHENVFTFSPDGSFHGRLKQQNIVVWTYSGRWSVSRGKLIWEYKENSPQKIPPGSKDSDGIVVVDDKELIIQEEKSGNFSKFTRVH